VRSFTSSEEPLVNGTRKAHANVNGAPRDFLRHGLALLPATLQDRATDLWVKAEAGGRVACPKCEAIAEQLIDAGEAARYDEYAAADLLLSQAEQAGLAHAADPDCPALRALGTPTPGQGQGGHYRVDLPDRVDSRPLYAATDASVKDKAVGLGYVITDGRFGMKYQEIGRRIDPTGPSVVTVSELRAVALLLNALHDSAPLTVLVDSLSAVRLLSAWQDGKTGQMPAGYSLRNRINAAQPTLVRLAERVVAARHIRFLHVKGHGRHLLNETADSLAKMARQQRPNNAANRAQDFVQIFLKAWHAENE
jgi:ribonuclease HI